MPWEWPKEIAKKKKTKKKKKNMGKWTLLLNGGLAKTVGTKAERPSVRDSCTDPVQRERAGNYADVISIAIPSPRRRAGNVEYNSPENTPVLHLNWKYWCEGIMHFSLTKHVFPSFGHRKV